MTGDLDLGRAPRFDSAFVERFDALLRWRRDVRHFSARAVEERDMQDLLMSAALAPSVGHAQPWRFVRLRSAVVRAVMTAHVDEQNVRASQQYMDDPRQAEYLALKLHGLREAPEVLAVFCDEQTATGHGLGIATMPEMLRYSCVTAVDTLWLAARVRGIGVGWVSILEPKAINRILDAPAQWSLIALLCIGYPDEETDMPDLEARGWQSREPLADRIFER